MPAYYNEFDPYAAQWLRNLITRGAIAPGDVDERSIEDVCPDDLRGYTQCHFFAGIGVWGHALRQAGWSDDTPVWTGSPPCQPFSEAGAGKGFDDERHLWPALFHLISECRPRTLFGEQVEAAIKHSWLDLVQTDLEGIGYAFGATGLCAAGFGAPHIRQRLFFAAKSLADATSIRRLGGRGSESAPVQGQCSERGGVEPQPEHAGELSGGVEGLRGDGDGDMGDAQRTGLEGHARADNEEFEPGWVSPYKARSTAAPSCTNGFWAGAEWLPFRDSKVRPVKPGIAVLVDGSPTIVGRLRGYGNAIVAPVAQEFIQAFRSCQP